MLLEAMNEWCGEIKKFKIEIALTILFASMIFSFRLPYLGEWVSSKIHPFYATEFMETVTNRAGLLYVLSFALTSSILGILLDYIRPRCRVIAALGTIGTALLLGISDQLYPWTPFHMYIIWIINGVTHSFLLFGFGCLLKEKVDVYYRGLVSGVGFFLGMIFHITFNTLSGFSIWNTATQLLLLIVAVFPLVLLRFERSGITEAVHVRDYRRYIFALPLFTFTYIMGGVLHLFSSDESYLFLRSSPIYILMIIPYVFSVVGGRICDVKGRKETGTLGYIFLGVGILSLYAHILTGTTSFLPMVGSTSLIAVGYAFVVPYIVTTWIDIPSLKYFGRAFALGVITASTGIIAGILISLLGGIIFTLTVGTFLIFAISFTIYRLPETLPKERVTKKQLLDYVEKAKKVAGKK